MTGGYKISLCDEILKDYFFLSNISFIFLKVNNSGLINERFSR